MREVHRQLMAGCGKTMGKPRAARQKGGQRLCSPNATAPHLNSAILPGGISLKDCGVLEDRLSGSALRTRRQQESSSLRRFVSVVSGVCVLSTKLPLRLNIGTRAW
jgi:hypothetical protein